MDLQLNGKIAIVTGATAGIGLAIARRLALEDAHVVLCGRSADRLADAKASIICGKVTTVVADPTTEAGARAIVRALPHADIVINNLGIYESKEFSAITDEDWLRFFKVNVLSGVRLTRFYLNGMLRQNWGRIIFISSDSALIVPPDVIHYGMTKTAQLAVSRGLAAATKGSGVTVNSILPGTTRSAGIVDFMRSVSSDPTLALERIEQEYFEKQADVADSTDDRARGSGEPRRVRRKPPLLSYERSSATC